MSPHAHPAAALRVSRDSAAVTILVLPSTARPHWKTLQGAHVSSPWNI